MSKQYGLILPNKAKLTPACTIKKPSIFEEESDSEEDVEKPTGLQKTIKRQDRIAREKAVEEDPTVYQYDEIYDEMEQKKLDLKLSRKDAEKKPKYITKLLVAADKRKRENERRIERQVQKEREAEGDEFKDKESFVTSAYRKKLEELKKQEEEEKREEYLEAIGDVTKQVNLDGFYRHLYEQKVNYADKIKDKEQNEETIQVKEESKDTEKESEDKKETVNDTNDETKSDSKQGALERKHGPKKRAYRKRESSESDDKEAFEDDKKLEHLPSNLDADSDFSIDSSDSEDSDEEPKHKKAKASKDVKANDSNETEDLDNLKNGSGKDVEGKKIEIVAKVDKKVTKEEVPVTKKPKIDIWKKRTVGKVFDEALQRYYERKALREAA